MRNKVKKNRQWKVTLFILGKNMYNIDMNRIYCLDCMKAFGVLLIILGHLPLLNEQVMKVIFSFHMPLFFICSGYVFKENSRQLEFVKRNASQLLLVMIPFFLIQLFFRGGQNYLFYKEDCTLQDVLIAPLKHFIFGESQIGWMWFLWTLFWMRYAYNTLCNLLNGMICKHQLIMAGSLLLGIIVFYSGFRINYYQICAFMLCMPFFCYGNLMREYSFLQYAKGRKAKWLIAFLLPLYVVLLSVCGKINMNALDVGESYFTYISIGIVANTLLMAIFNNIKTRGLAFVTIISGGSLVYLCFHGMLIQVFKLLYKKLMSISIPPPIHGYNVRYNNSFDNNGNTLLSN